MKEKLKSLINDDAIYLSALLIGVGLTSFLLGQMSVSAEMPQDSSSVNTLALCPTAIAKTTNFESAVMTSTIQTQSVAENTTLIETNEKVYVASKAGTKYHHITCPGAKQIKEANKIFFATVEKAMSAGYSKAANCNQ